MKKVFAAVMTFAILGAACAPAPGNPGGSQPGGTGASAQQGPTRLTIAIRGDPKFVTGKLSLGTVGGIPGVDEIEEMLNAGLSNIDRGNRLHPQLAEQMPTVENGLWQVFPDGRMETTWKIRQTAKWHDGAPFTSDDLLFTATVEQDRALPIFRNVAYASVEAIEAPDPYTVTVRWTQPFIEADTMFSNRRGLPMPRHVLERNYLEDKDNFLNIGYWNNDFIGAGPYKLREFSIGSGVVLDANDSYALGRPKIDRIDVRFIPDPGTIAANILAGEVDMTIGGRLSVEWATQVRSQWRAGDLKTSGTTTMISAYPQFINPNPPILLDARFRKALLYAVDRQQIVDSLVEGLSQVGHSIISQDDDDWQYIQSRVVTYNYDPARAAQMLDGLGYARGTDGLYRDATGQRLTVEARTTATDDTQTKTMLSLADNWQKLGLGVDQVAVPQQRESDREYRATRQAFEIVRQPGGSRELTTRWHGTNTPLPENDYTGQNRTRHQNPEFDRLIDRFFQTIPHGERMQVLGDIVNYMTDQVLILPIYWDPMPTMMTNKLQNVHTPGQVWDVHEWELR
jgi:peptide/nickel transport system substrate-binding protein